MHLKIYLVIPQNSSFSRCNIRIHSNDYIQTGVGRASTPLTLYSSHLPLFDPKAGQ